MCIIEDLLQVSHSKDAENYYHSVEDAKSESLYKGISIGEKRGEKRGRTLGREEAYKEMAKIFHIPYEVILEKTKQNPKQMRK